MPPKRKVIPYPKRPGIKLDLLCPQCLEPLTVAAVSGSNIVGHCVNCRITLTGRK